MLLKSVILLCRLNHRLGHPDFRTSSWVELLELKQNATFLGRTDKLEQRSIANELRHLRINSFWHLYLASVLAIFRDGHGDRIKGVFLRNPISVESRLVRVHLIPGCVGID